MTDLATRARQLSESCEARKIAYRQSKDGIVVSFVLHPNEVPDGLTLAPLGQRYVLALVALDDDETPKEVMQHSVDAMARPKHKTVPVSEAVKAPGRAQVAPEKRLVQRAGILCSDPLFQAFLLENKMIPSKNENDAAVAVRMICGVDSRVEIIPGSASAKVFDDLYGKFIAWRSCVEPVS